MGVHTGEKLGIFSSLHDDLVGLIINQVKDKQDRKSFSEVCKQWFKLEGLDRSSLTLNVTNPGFSLHALTRFPNIVSMRVRDCQTHTDLEFIAQTCPKIESVRVECRDEKPVGGVLSPKGLRALGEGCPKLCIVDIVGRKAIGNSGVVELLHSTHNLDALGLLDNELISDEALRGIGCTSSISILDLIHCHNITDEGLAFLANGSTSRTLKKLIIDCCPEITDTGVEHLRKMCSLESLELCLLGTRSPITDIGGLGISAIRTLKELILIHPDVSDSTMVALAENCSKLETLDIKGCENVTIAGICAFCNHKCLKILTHGRM
ncbi:PREDICTED: F-box/LRR-repeat protein 20-like [Fragaria vesca subsp. vesca]|uniref:F-box/LRR-repeat protein 20-like n=1 Tax=Fragaria vesca subsp. vesca TaxID=101020 RepID=UPI0002C2EBA7|nr:PREDICTED: F-box/LRR-repeat protein 20-like [Fragaria vesca subsp. vesca]